MSEPGEDQRTGEDRRRSRRGGRRLADLEHYEEATLSVGEFARYLTVRTRQVWKWYRAGLIEIIQLPDRCDRIATEEALRFIAVHRLKRSA